MSPCQWSYAHITRSSQASLPARLPAGRPAAPSTSSLPVGCSLPATLHVLLLVCLALVKRLLALGSNCVVVSLCQAAAGLAPRVVRAALLSNDGHVDAPAAGASKHSVGSICLKLQQVCAAAALADAAHPPPALPTNAVPALRCACSAAVACSPDSAVTFCLECIQEGLIALGLVSAQGEVASVVSVAGLCEVNPCSGHKAHHPPGES